MGNIIDGDQNSAWQGEFSNIKNNSLWQIKKFEPVRARFIKLHALRNTENDNAAGYAELDVITN